VPGLFNSISADRDYAPCPFDGERYQWMRNLAAAQALAGKERSWAAAVVFADGVGLHAAATDWAAFKSELARDVRFQALSYQALIDLFSAANVAAGLGSGEWPTLLAHVQRKIISVTGRK
jgi:hypothetical protein